MNGIHNSLNTLSLVTAGMALALGYISRIGAMPILSASDYVDIFALSATIFCLPDFLCFCFPSRDTWYRSSEFYTFFLIIFLATSGMFFGWLGVSPSFVILPVGIGLALWESYHFLTGKNWLTLLAGTAFAGFIILLFYSQDYHSPLFPEKIILGKAHIDTLFHCSISNTFSTLGFPSTGLNGSPYVFYHWGSHALFGGLKHWIGLNTLMFYNIAYPAIFIPLFFKCFFSFLNSLYTYKKVKSLNLLFAISLFTVIYSTGFAGFKYAQPFLSESLCVSLIFTLLYASMLLFYACHLNKTRRSFFASSMLSLIVISLCKISTGVVYSIGVGYLYFRFCRRCKHIFAGVIAGAIIGAVIYLFVFPIEFLTGPLRLAQRINYLWLYSDGFLPCFLGAFVAVMVIMKTQPLSKWGEWRSIIESRQYTDLEILFVITISGFSGAMVASTDPDNVYYFCSPQIFLSVPFLLLYAQRYFERFRASYGAKTCFLCSLIILGIISRPEAMKGGFDILRLKKDMLSLSAQQRVLKGFVVELFALDRESDKKTKCIYIPQTEKWFYESQKYRPMGGPFVAPAISGVALIAGIPDNIMESDYGFYSFYYYKQGRQKLRVSGLNDAKAQAYEKGFRELLEYYSVDGRLAKETFDLSKENEGLHN